MKKLKLNSKSILAVLFCAVLVFFLGTITERIFRYSFLGQTPDTVASETAEGDSDQKDEDNPYLRQFPFKNGDEPAASAPEKTESKVENTENNIFAFIRSKMDYLKINTSFYTEKLLFARMNFLDLNAKYNKAIGMKMFEDANSSVITLLDGNLAMRPYKSEISGSAENVAEFAKKLKTNGADFLYVQAPSKVDPQNNLLPSGLEDYDNQAADEMLAALRKNDVDCLDIRQLLHEQNISYTDAFFRTDHHWTIDTAFWASGEIVKHIEKNTDIQIDSSKFNIDDFTRKVYKGISLGSLGKIVTASYAEPEDFMTIIPDFETDFRYHDFYDGSERTGSFEKALMNTDILKEKDLYNVSTYSAYMYTWSDLVSVENKLSQNDTSVLIIGDSFRNSVVPFLSLGFKNVYSMATTFSGSINTFIEEYKPDMVIILVYPPVISSFSNGIK